MIFDYNWKQYHDRAVRENPRNEDEEELAKQASAELVKKFIGELTPKFKKRVMKDMAKHMVDTMDRPDNKDDDDTVSEDSLVSDIKRRDSLFV